MKYGLSVPELEKIRLIFTRYGKVNKVLLFGSRAMGNHKPGSDVDLAIQGNNINLNDIISLSIQFDDLDSLVNFDLLSYSSINDPAVLDHINRVGVTVFDRLTNVSAN